MIVLGERRRVQGGAAAVGAVMPIRPRAAVRSLAGITAGIVLLHVLVQAFVPRGTLGDSVWVRLSALDGENTLPTWWASTLLAIAAVLAWAVYRRSRLHQSRWRWHWAGMALLMVLFSLDEVASFHETLSFPVREAFDLDGVFFYAWVIPAMAAVVVVGVVYLRFALALPASIRWRVIVAGTLFVGGAIGMEMVGGSFAADPESLGYVLASTVEEALEMAGVVLLIDALFRMVGPIHLTMGETVPATLPKVGRHSR